MSNKNLDMRSNNDITLESASNNIDIFKLFNNSSIIKQLMNYIANIINPYIYSYIFLNIIIIILLITLITITLRK